MIRSYPNPNHCSACNDSDRVIEFKIGEVGGSQLIRFCAGCRLELARHLMRTFEGDIADLQTKIEERDTVASWSGSVSLRVLTETGPSKDPTWRPRYVGVLGNEGSCRVLETSLCDTWEAAVRAALTTAAVRGLKVVNREVYDRALDAIAMARILATPDPKRPPSTRKPKATTRKKGIAPTKKPKARKKA